jgi:superfamily II DNA or RNA helicase
MQLSLDTILHEQTQTELQQARNKLIAEQRLETERHAADQEQEHEAHINSIVSMWRNELLTLRPYQHEGRIFLRESSRAMCTLPPGLGKTETAISACLDDTGLQADGPIGICCPGHLTDMWFDRILKYLPNAKIVEISGTRKQRTKGLALNADWYIFNYEMLHTRPSRKKISVAARQRANNGTLSLDDFIEVQEDEETARIMEARRFDFPSFKYVIFDESHHLKSTNSKRAQAAAELVRDINTKVFMLSGTPIKRDPDDLYMQCHILMPHENYNTKHPDLHFSEYYDFIRRYCITLPSPYGSQTRIYGARKTNIENLMNQVSYFMSYEDADVHRPDIEEQTINIRMDDRHEHAYDSVERAYMYDDITFHSAMEVMHALRAVTFAPQKVQAAVDIALDLNSVYDPQHPDQVNGGVFFTIYQSSAHALAASLNRALGLTDDDPNRIIPLTGEIPVAERSQMLDDMIRRKVPFIVGTLGCISEGKDLSYMKAVTFLEETWTHLEIEQGIDRVRRAGSTETKINVYYLHMVHKDNGAMTIDGEIHNVQHHRGMTAEVIIRRVMERARARLKRQGAKI